MIVLTVLYQTVAEKLTLFKCYPMALHLWSVPSLSSLLFWVCSSFSSSPSSFLPALPLFSVLMNILKAWIWEMENGPPQNSKNHTPIIFPAHLYTRRKIIPEGTTI